MNSYFRFIFLLIVIFLSLTSVFPQKPGNVEVIADPSLQKLVDKHKYLNDKINGIPGFRIQIFSESGTNSKNKADKVKEDFAAKFSDQQVYLLFQEPNYKVRIGDFRTQLDALGYLHKIQQAYPSAFIVSDKINFPKLN